MLHQGVEVGIYWHGHRDRGLDLANNLAAIKAGATRVHGPALGIGERVGNTAMEQLLVNLKLLGLRDDDLSKLPDYLELVSAAVDRPISCDTPIVARDAIAAVLEAAKSSSRILDEEEILRIAKANSPNGNRLGRSSEGSSHRHQRSGGGGLTDLARPSRAKPLSIM